MNPSVTLTYLTLGRLVPRTAAFYIAAQVLGGILGVQLGRLVVGPPLGDMAVNYVATVPGTGGPTTAFAAEVADECERLLASLDSDDLRQVAILKMEGFTNAEIAERLDCAPRTVDRRLQLIRDLWADKLNEASTP